MITTDALDLDPIATLRLTGFLDRIGAILGHRKRKACFAAYALGLFGNASRKSAEPIAAGLCPDPDQVEAAHSKLLHFLRRSEWEDAPIRRYAAGYALELMTEHAPVNTWVVDDTGFLKKGNKSPGVQRQYTGSAGKVTNCQIAVSLTVATEHHHLPIDFRLYLPQVWADDRARCREAKIPDGVGYKPKWRLALDMVEAAVEAEVPQGVVVADSDYGDKPGFRDGLESLGLSFVVGIHRTTSVRLVRGRTGRCLGPPMPVQELAFSLDPKLFRKVTWREGTKAPLESKCAVVRVQVEHQDGREPTTQWLLIEWPDGEHLPVKFGLSNLPPQTPRKRLFRLLKERWRTERAYQDLKGQLGLDHFEGRSFPGWHHHVTVALCCYAFCVAEQVRSFFPSARRTRRDDSLPRAA